MRYPMDAILVQLALFVLPALFLLVFCSLKNRRVIWLAIPASLGAFLLCCGTLLSDPEFRGFALFGIIPYLAVWSAVTALAAFLKKKQKRQPNLRIPAIVSAVLIAAVLGLATHNALLNTVNGYRRVFDRAAFTRLTQIQPRDVVSVEVEVFRVTLEEDYTDYRGDMTFFADLEFIDSMLARPGLPGDGLRCSVHFTLQNGDYAHFVQYEGDEFEVFFVEGYVHRIFYVKSPQLLAEIT